MVDPTLPLKSEVKELYPSPSLVDPTLHLESEVKVVELMSSPPNPTLSLETVETEVVPSTESSYSRSLLIKSENHPAEVFVVSSDCSMQEEVLSLSIEPSPSSEVISFDWSNLTEYRLHSSVPFQISVPVTAKSILRTNIDEGAYVSILSSTAWKAIGSPFACASYRSDTSF